MIEEKSNGPRAEKSRMGIGARLGSAIGNWAESGLRSLFGGGDYEEVFDSAGGFDVEENTIVKPMSAEQVPLINTVEDGTIHVQHREFLGDISATTAAAFAVYILNPTNIRTFPWLSTLARLFEEWEPCGIVFETLSTAGNAVSSTNASLGTVSLATQYNVREMVFVDKTRLLNHFYATSTKTSRNLMHAIECAPLERQNRVFFTGALDGAPSLDDDPRFRNLGLTTVWTQGSQANYIAAELWITYDIKLMKPRMPPPPAVRVTFEECVEQLRQYLKTHDGLQMPVSELRIPPPPIERKERDVPATPHIHEVLAGMDHVHPAVISRFQNLKQHSLVPPPPGLGQPALPRLCRS